MSAWASWARFFRALANFSNSSRVSEPNSLHGARCSASSMTPSFRSQERESPWKWFINLTDCLLLAVQLFNLCLQVAGNHITFQLAIRSQHSVLNRERLCMDVKCPNLLVMRHLRVQSIQRRLHLLAGYAAGHDC